MAAEKFDFFSNAPVTDAAVVQLPPEPSAWLTIGGPVGLVAPSGVVVGPVVIGPEQDSQ